MKRFHVFLMPLAVAATWQSQASAAEPPPERTTLIQKLFGPSKPKPTGPSVRDSQRPFTISAHCRPTSWPKHFGPSRMPDLHG